VFCRCPVVRQEMLEDVNEVIRSNDHQTANGKNKMDKRTNIDQPNTTHKTKDWETRTSLKPGILRCSGRIRSSCSTVGTHRVTQTFNSIDHLHNIYLHMCSRYELCVMVFNATFNNISVISWRSPESQEKPPTCHKSDKLYHI
jgi:hypothetical protein